MSTSLLLLFFFFFISVSHNVPIIGGVELPSINQHTFDEWWVHLSTPTASATSNVSEKCLQDSGDYLTGLFEHRPWAVQMYESSGKVIENLIHIEGGEDVHHESGLFDECLSVQSDEIPFQGQYCTVFFGLEPVTEGQSSTHHPADAVESDLRSAVAQQLGYRASSGKNFSVVAVSSEDYCHTEEKIHGRRTAFDNVTLVFLSMFAVLAVTVLTATVHDVWFDEDEQKTVESSLAIQLLRCFSARRNCRRLFKTAEESKDDLSCLHGIRVLATCWMVLIHTGGAITSARLVYNRQIIVENTLRWQFQFITNGLFAVNTFFLLSGLLVAYTQLRQLDQHGGFFNIKRFYGHRYMRLTPVYAFVLAFVATLYPYLGTGPDWNSVEQKSKSVRMHWWTNMLYINNYVNPTANWWTNPNMGAGETWYLACDMQMLWISPLLIYPLWRWKRAGILWALSLLSLFLAMSATLFIAYELPATVFWLRASDTSETDAYADKHYADTFARFPAYLVGILLGWLLYKTSDRKIHLNRSLVIAGWVIAISIGLAVTYGMLPYLDESAVPVIDPIAVVSYGVLHHLAWAITIGWVIFACTRGYGGLIHRFLSWKFFIPLSRLSYAVYLLHLHYIFAYVAHFRKPVYLTEYVYGTTYFGVLVITFLMASAASVLVEIPFVNLDKLLFSKKAQSSVQTKKEK